MTTLQGTPPGSYIWDGIKFIGRITLKGTEDQRFTASGACSFLNGITSGSSLSSPSQTAKDLLSPEKNDYLVKGYTLFLGEGIDLKSEHWIAQASDALNGIHGIKEILFNLSQDKAVEERVKLQTIQKLFWKELKRRRLGDDPRVVKARTEYDQRVKSEKLAAIERAAEQKRAKERERREAYLRAKAEYQDLVDRVVQKVSDHHNVSKELIADIITPGGNIYAAPERAELLKVLDDVLYFSAALDSKSDMHMYGYYGMGAKFRSHPQMQTFRSKNNSQYRGTTIWHEEEDRNRRRINSYIIIKTLFGEPLIDKAIEIMSVRYNAEFSRFSIYEQAKWAGDQWIHKFMHPKKNRSRFAKDLGVDPKLLECWHLRSHLSNALAHVIQVDKLFKMFY